MSPTPPTAPCVIRVIAWRDVLAESTPGATPTASMPTLSFWAPVIGPTAALIAVRWASDSARHTTAAHWTLETLAATFGVAPAVAWRAVGRLERFGVVCRRHDTVAVRLVLPPLSQGLRRRLPAHLAVEYESFLAEPATVG